MAEAKQLGHRVAGNMGLKYMTNDNPVSTDLMFVGGKNVMTSLRGYAERRPGFALALEPVPTTFAGKVTRIATWRRWDDAASGVTRGAFFVMVCEVSGSTAKVYKLQVGTDQSFALIYTASNPASTTIEPFDFCEANNHVFFSNDVAAMKYDGTTVSQWGIYAPGSAPTIVVSGDIPYDNEIRPTAYGTAVGTAGVAGAPWQAYDGFLTDGCPIVNANVTWYGFPKAAGSPTALTLQVNSEVVINGGTIMDGSAALYYSIDSGATWTAIYSVSASTGHALNTDGITLSRTMDLTQLQVRGYVNKNGYMSMNVYEIWVDVSYSGQASSSAVTGNYYCYTYGNSKTGHESSPSPTSFTGIINATAVAAKVVASPDTQVDQIRVYRSPDGGADDPVLMQEISGSPFANLTAVIPDPTLDEDLGTRVAPARYRNDPPRPMRGLIYASSNRIFGFVGNKVYYSGAEEIGNGVQEECFPGGGDGNFKPYASDVNGLACTEAGGTTAVVVFLASSLEYIQGDSLDTFRYGNLMRLRGTRQRATVKELGGTVVWLDTASQMFQTGVNELTVDIRPDIEHIDHTQAQTAIHLQGNSHHLYLMDGASGTLYVLDYDTQQWMPPWDVDNCSAIHSGEIAAGQRALLLARNGKILKQSPGVYNDDGAAYPVTAPTNLFGLVPDENPSHVGVVDHIAIEYTGTQPTVRQSTDEIPLAGMYVDSGTAIDSPRRTQGTMLKETWFNFNTPTARKAAFEFSWPAEDKNFQLFTLAVGYRQIGT